MQENPHNIFTKCQDDLTKQGFFIRKLALPSDLKTQVEAANYPEIDSIFQRLTSPGGHLYETLRTYAEFTEIEFIISLREAKNEWEEDGIWHDDGSRVLAFSLSLTLEPPKGGVLEIRKKGETTLKLTLFFNA